MTEPNTSQKDFLETLIGEDGIYWSNIQDDKVFNIGTKTLYLKRALSEDPRIFLQSLDMLYNPNLAGAAEAAHIEFLRALKTINDLCFNNQLKFDDNVVPALDHFFQKLGDVDPQAFQSAIKKSINERINELGRALSPEEVSLQIADREAAEKNNIPSREWRDKLDLPLEQVRVFTDEQYQQLSLELRQIIDSNNQDFHILMNDFGLTFELTKTSTPEVLKELIMYYATSLNSLAEVQISLTELLTLSPSLSIQVLQHPTHVAKLIKRGPITLQQLAAVDNQTREKILWHSEIFLSFIQKGLSLEKFAALGQDEQEELIDNPNPAERIVDQMNYPFNQLIALNSKTRTTLLNNSDFLPQFIARLNINFTDLVDLDVLTLDLLLKNYKAVYELVNMKYPFSQLKILDYAVLEELLNNSNTVIRFIQQDFTVTDLVAVNQVTRTTLFENSTKTHRLLRDLSISMKQLCDLDPSKIQAVLNNPNYDQSKATLKTYIDDAILSTELTHLNELLNSPTSKFLDSNSDGIKKMKDILSSDDKTTLAKLDEITELARRKIEPSVVLLYSLGSFFGKGRDHNVHKLYQKLAVIPKSDSKSSDQNSLSSAAKSIGNVVKLFEDTRSFTSFANKQ